ncbi:hypothetical protein LTR10_024399 [Elasticomyces elasticus]|uniref:Phytanoyl-CoA dioxygenase n=1 Tax=Exophiala sideris TaxID=1016849 RepID=A0ABR0JI21_9EURO|nr:hypothetical protein LTR10_024399 [Elasticomyces elasticus]KAK5034209.1 hypothetical protein LTS07_003129 [Exophiala sideris]KAK5042505.1 hypothetical protein LTR13_001352 [Exophiala sideris]KAK5065587.1 hypothetical protein LTR69_003136 [Exophiala sideris]KAK5185955.1 hypothetical protein LTR44_002004 [Eurotiomycetes sp. CCFEE 6388]
MATVEVQGSPRDSGLPESLSGIEGSVPRSQLGWLRCTPVDTPITEMRRRLFQDEYVFVKGLLPREDVLKMRQHYFSQFKGFGLLEPGTDPVDGIYNSAEDVSLHNGIGGGEPTGEELQALVTAHVQQHYLDFVAHPKLRSMVRELMEWDEEVMLMRTMLRHNIPGGKSTGLHYDKLFLRGGDAFFLTAWVPIGDIAPGGGGLFYLEDGIELAEAIEDDFNERAKDFSLEEKISAFNRNMTATGVLTLDPSMLQEDNAHLSNKEKFKWLVANYEAGDVVFHLPYTIHSAGANRDSNNSIRLSTDLRFHDKKDFDAGTIDERWMKYWTPGDGL